MLKTLRTKIAATIYGLTLLLTPMLAPALVAAAPATTGGGATITTCLSQGSDLKLTDNTCTTAGGQANAATQVNSIITTAVNIFSIIVGIVAVVMIIYGGFKYITSGGESGNITGAKNTIVYAVIGLVVVALAQFVVQFVLNKATPTA